jgi:hypothetical protein
MLARHWATKMGRPLPVRYCEHGVQTFLLCRDCEADRCKCGSPDTLDPYYICEVCERRIADQVPA